MHIIFDAVYQQELSYRKQIARQLRTQYTSLFHQRNGSSKNTYNIINKQKKHNTLKASIGLNITP